MNYRIIKTNFLLSTFSARTLSIPFINYSFILIRPDKFHDVALINHEIMHVNQHANNKAFHIIKYLTSINYRYVCELEAYAMQLVALYLINRDEILINYNLKLFSEFLIKNYFLYNIDWQEFKLNSFDIEVVKKDLFNKYRELLKYYTKVSMLPYKNWLI